MNIAFALIPPVSGVCIAVLIAAAFAAITGKIKF